MAIIAPVENGKVVEDTTKANKKDDKNTADKEMFLKLLVAEMQYQDPLEPTSNTEYIAQMATFSQVESMLNMQNTMTASEANALVGKYVIMKVTSSTTGEVSYSAGNVDYVLHQNGKTYLSIKGSLYNIEDLDTVADADYMEAVALAEEFKKAVEELPPKNQISLSDKDAIVAICNGYNSLSDYQRSFIDKDVLKSFEEKFERYNELVKAQEGTGGDSTEDSDNSESAGDTEGVS